MLVFIPPKNTAHIEVCMNLSKDPKTDQKRDKFQILSLIYDKQPPPPEDMKSVWADHKEQDIIKQRIKAKIVPENSTNNNILESSISSTNVSYKDLAESNHMTTSESEVTKPPIQEVSPVRPMLRVSEEVEKEKKKVDPPPKELLRYSTPHSGKTNTSTGLQVNVVLLAEVEQLKSERKRLLTEKHSLFSSENIIIIILALIVGYFLGLKF